MKEPVPELVSKRSKGRGLSVASWHRNFTARKFSISVEVQKEIQNNFIKIFGVDG